VVVQGKVDHADSNGNAVRYGDGDVQWMTAGRGLQHSEMFPLLDTQGPNDLVLFQIWLNLPRTHKMVAPQYVVFPAAEIPKPTTSCSRVTVIAGAWHDTTPSWRPPADSWGYEAAHEVGVWLLETTGACEITLPATVHADTQRTMYVYNNTGTVWFDQLQVLGNRGVRLEGGVGATFKTAGATKSIILQGRPIGEPVAQRGPMVMNTQQEVQQAFSDYQRTQFGGWPWPRHDVVLPTKPQSAKDEL
jgi:quercetin 2,3-dioxygenase